MKNSRIFKTLAIGCLLFVGRLHGEQPAGWQNPDDERTRHIAGALVRGINPVEPVAGRSSLQARNLNTSVADDVTPEIEALARGLQNDAFKIYQYCWERIRYECYWGSKKGAALTLLEGSGNCFDTASLMVALLRAAGFEEVEYRYGQRFLYEEDMENWLGVLSYYSFDGIAFPDKTNAQFRTYFGLSPTYPVDNDLRLDLLKGDFLTKRGLPHFALDQDNSSFSIPHVWVKFKDSQGVVREMDPSVKWVDRFMEDFVRPTSSNIGYTRSTFLSAIGGTVASGGREVSGITTAGTSGLDGQFSTFTGNFRTWLKNNHSAASTEEFINRGYPERSFGTLAGQSLVPGQSYVVEDAFIPAVSWPEIPVEWEMTITFAFGQNYDDQNDEFGTDHETVTIPVNSLKGRKLSLTFEGTTAHFRLDETSLATFTVTQPTVQLKMAVDHPKGFLDTNGDFQDDGVLDQSEVKTYKRASDAAYAIIYGFDSSPLHLKKSQDQLDYYRNQGYGNTDWRVRTEALNVMGLNYLDQVAAVTRMASTRQKVLPQNHHIFGRMAQEDAYFIDVGLGLGGDYSYAGRRDTLNTSFQVSSHFASALEHGIIEQSQGPGVSAISTAKILQLANAQGLVLHLADNSNWTSVRSTLETTGNGWPGWVLDRIAAQITGATNIANNAQVLLPRKGNIGLVASPPAGQWRGYGYSLVSSVTSGMFIQGGYAPDVYSGGHLASGNGTVSSSDVARYGHSEPGYYSLNNFLNGTPHDSVTVPKWRAADPVDMATGAFILEATDLQCGFPLPRGLSFHRSYNSNRSSDSSQGLGYGWTHNMDIRATRRSAARAGLGESTPEQMAATYVSVMVAMDVFANRTNAKDLAVTALASCWGVDQLRDNGVSVQMGNTSIEFVKMPNGTFVPPAGITMTLTEGSGGALDLAERHGNIHHFNAAGRITSTEDLHGAEATFGYEDVTVGGATKTVLKTVADDFGRQLVFTWSNGQIEKVTETAGSLSRDVEFAYDAGCLTDATDPEGKTFQYGYAQNRIDSLTDGRGRIITENEYDAQGRVYEQRLHGETNKTFQLFFSGMRNIERNPAGGETVFLYDRYGRGAGIIDATGNRSSIYYDGQNRKIESASPKNNGTFSAYRPTRFTYDANHNLTEFEIPKRSATDTAGPYTADRIYDGQMRLWKDYDLKGNFTEYTYTAKHQIYQIKDRKGVLVQTNAYNTDGTLASVTDGAGNQTKYLNYDSFGNPQTIEYPAVTLNGASVVPTEGFVYDARCNLKQHTDRNGNVTGTTYNERRQPLVTTLAAVAGVSSTRETIYDDAGNPWQMKDERGNWTVTETSQTGKVLSTRLPSTAAGTPTVNFHYDSRDWFEWSRDPSGRQITYVKDAAGRVSSATDPLDRIVQNFYNADGELEETRDARNKSSFFRYNWRGELYEAENALTHKASNLYDANGNKDFFYNKRNKAFDFDYDNNGRLLSLKTPLLKPTSRDWNSRGLATYVQEPSGDRTEFGYDNMGRLKETLHKGGGSTVSTLTRALDKHGNLKKLTEVTPAGTLELEFPDHDARNRINTFVDVRDKTIGYRHDRAGNLVELIYPNGRGSVIYTYDSHNRLETVTDWSNRTTRYHYDLNGRLNRVERPNGTERRFAWDAVGQMRGASEISSGGQPLYYSLNRHDDAGRRDREIVFPALQPHTPPAFSAVYDDDNRLSSFNGSSVTHDDDGNLTTGPLGGSASSTFVYDSRNRLTSAGGLSYTYDPTGNRIAVTGSGGETKWTIDPTGSLSRALVREKPGGEETWYVYGLGLLYEVDEADDTVTYHYDAKGSTVALTADNGQTVLDRINYDPYGRETWRQASHDTPFRYHGAYGLQTDSNGLCHMRARYYHPQIRRFLHADPIGFDGGSNWYQFASGNPVAFADPLGLEPITSMVGGKEVISTLGVMPSNWQPYEGLSKEDAMTGLHLTLDGVGLIPGFGEIADGTNGVIYLFEGNKVDAGLSFAAMIPIAGWGATGAKGLRYVDEVVDVGGGWSDEAYEILDGVRRAKANQMVGNQSMVVDVYDHGGETFLGSREVLVDWLKSPNKSVIEVNNLTNIERFAEIHSGVIKGDNLPNIRVREGANGTPISDIQFKY